MHDTRIRPAPPAAHALQLAIRTRTLALVCLIAGDDVALH